MRSYFNNIYQLPTESLKCLQKEFILKAKRCEKNFKEIKDLNKGLNIFIRIIYKIRLLRVR